MNQKLISIFLNKYQTNHLANFYILSSQKDDSQNDLNNWIQKYLESVLINHQESTDFVNHEDILILAPESKFYNADDIELVHKFTNHNARLLNRKFLIFKDAASLNINQYNKLLKIFEEPPVELSIFLLNPHNAAILNTIESRAIKLKIQSSAIGQKNIFEAIDFEHDTFQNFAQYVTKQNITVKELLRNLLDLYSEKCTHFKTLVKAQDQIKNIEQDIVYNNSSQHQLLKIYHLLNQLK